MTSLDSVIIEALLRVAQSVISPAGPEEMQMKSVCCLVSCCLASKVTMLFILGCSCKLCILIKCKNYQQCHTALHAAARCLKHGTCGKLFFWACKLIQADVMKSTSLPKSASQSTILNLCMCTHHQSQSRSRLSVHLPQRTRNRLRTPHSLW